MNAAESRDELTSTIHLGIRGVAHKSSGKTLDDLISTLDEKSKEIVREIAQSSGDKAMVLIARGPQKGSRFLITAEGVSIGRSTESSIFLDDVTVSRSHAQIKREENGFVLIDNSSLNGTYLNNISVDKNVLKSGDEIQIGKFHFVFIGNTK